MTILALKGLCKEYSLNKQKFEALCDINLEVKKGAFISLVGKSGCGKTTLLKLIAGLETKSKGQIIFTPSDIKVGMVFQEARLMPWLTVEENMALSLHNIQDEEIKNKRIEYYLDMMGLSKFRKAYPKEISGGMAQRVALARALCYDAELILMDEPLGALDAFTRKNLQEELVNIFLKAEKTIIFVTHDVDEAVYLGQQVLVMEDGKILNITDISLSYPRDIKSEAFYNLRTSILNQLTKCEVQV